MSLEAALNRNSDLLEKHNALIEQMLAAGQAALAAKGKATPAADKAAATKEPEAKAFDVEAHKALIQKCAGWLGEFGKEGAEADARKAKFSEALGKLGVKKAGEIADADKSERLAKWLDKQVKAGRITPEPEPEEAASTDDEI